MERKITALKAQKKNPNRVSVYLDGEYAFGLAKIVAAWLQVGQVLTDEKIDQLQAKDAEEVAYQRALRFLSYRPRSESEVREKLVKLGFEQQVIDAVIQRLIDSRFLGDQEFAQTWVENRSTFRPRSRRVLALELRQKGVEEEIIQEALHENVDDQELAYKAAIQYSRRLEGLEWEDFRKRLSGFLGRRGFSYGTIAPVVKQLWSEMHSGEGNDATW
ncbi:MAG TPA: hypothetical protein GYA06_05975 [Chloroflexi bacterium]|mgnify:CR=1 FL=1|jgi:regulatory protein|nr:hypothetical protein [Chloroflexota bacterium]